MFKCARICRTLCKPSRATTGCRAVASKRVLRHYASVTTDKDFDAEYDVIVAGSGAGALSTAATASMHGLRTLVVEKSKYIGGTSAYSLGGVWIPANHLQREGVAMGQAVGPWKGFEDTREQAETYLRNLLGDDYDDTMIRAYLKRSPQMMKWMEDNTSLGFHAAFMPDYHPTVQGANLGRSVGCRPFDGRKLGKCVKDIRYQIQGYKALGSFQTSPAELAQLTRPFSSVGNFVFMAKRLARYFFDVLQYGKGTMLYNGNALVGSLLHTATQAGTEYWLKAPASELIVEDGVVTGIVVQRDNQTIRVRAKKGVVLATGGLAHGQTFIPKNQLSVCPRGIEGDGINMAKAVGAAMPEDPDPDQALYTPVSLYHTKEGPVHRFPHFGFDRAKPGSIVVNQQGKRFANESESYQTFVKTMQRKDISTAYLICDHRFLTKYGFGLVLPWPYPFNRAVTRSGYLLRGKSIQELASKIGVNESTLVETVRKMNESARLGKDDEFGRGENDHDTFSGDWQVKPNPSLGPCDTAPFYAIPIHPGNVGTVWGLSTTDRSQVLDQNQNPIPGLYAAGTDQNSWIRGSYPGGGCSLGPALTSGWIAGMHMAGKLSP